MSGDGGPGVDDDEAASVLPLGLEILLMGGMVSAGLPPTNRMVSALAMDSRGKGSPRSTPNARIPAAAAEDIQKRPL